MSVPLFNVPDEPQKEIRHLGADEKIFDLYHWSEVLQESGDGGKVVVCQPKEASGATDVAKKGQCDTYVLKMRSKDSLQKQHMSEQFRDAQLRVLNFPPHPGVLSIHEVLEDHKFYYVVMEKASGGTFFDGLMKEFTDGVMPPRAVKRLMQEILQAVRHVHHQGMLHRDIKPDNLVMRLVDDPSATGGKTRRVALIDFDHAEIELDRNGHADGGWVGTYQFSAPETFLGHFSYSSDLYSVGVILYLLMTGKMPYDHPIYKEWWEHGRASGVYPRMKEAQIDWDSSAWKEQPLCLDFCNWLLEFDPEKRCSCVDEAYRHEWLQ